MFLGITIIILGVLTGCVMAYGVYAAAELQKAAFLMPGEILKACDKAMLAKRQEGSGI